MQPALSMVMWTFPFHPLTHFLLTLQFQDTVPGLISLLEECKEMNKLVRFHKQLGCDIISQISSYLALTTTLNLNRECICCWSQMQDCLRLKIAESDRNVLLDAAHKVCSCHSHRNITITTSYPAPSILKQPTEWMVECSNDVWIRITSPYLTTTISVAAPHYHIDYLYIYALIILWLFCPGLSQLFVLWHCSWSFIIFQLIEQQFAGLLLNAYLST